MIMIWLLVATAVPAGAAVELRCATGITATIHAPGEIGAGLLVERAGRVFLEHPAAGSVELDLSGSKAWQPFDPAVVAAAIEGMHGFTAEIAVDVFVLPAPPAGVRSSFARPGAVFLAPAGGDVADQTVAYITVHELGHVLTAAFVDGQPGRWEAYRHLRGIDGGAYGPDAAHAWRPREILAEDLRALFGGRLATMSGSIENHDLVLPDRVAGLRELLVGFLAGRAPDAAVAASSAWPNPCNPLTTVEMVLPDGVSAGGAAELRIYDVRGALVQIVRGGTDTGGGVAMQWRGDLRSGAAAASGRYLYVMTAAGLTARGAVTLVR